MSLRDLALGGADCSDGNAISSFAKHSQQDRSLFNENMNRMGESSQRPFASNDRQFEQEFFAQQRPNGAFDMGEMSQHLDSINLRDFRQAPSSWADDFAQQNMSHGGHHALHDPEFERIYQNPAVQTGGWESEFLQSHESFVRPDNYEDLERIYNEATHRSWADEFEETPQQRGDAWAQEFEEQKGKVDDKLAISMSAGRFVETVTDPKIQQTKFMAFMRQLRDREVEIEDNKVVEVKVPAASDWTSEFEAKISSARLEETEAPPKLLQWVDSEGNETSWENEYVLHNKGKGRWTEEFQQEADQAWEDEYVMHSQIRKPMEEPQHHDREGDPFESWTEMFRKSIAPLQDQEADNWDAMEKDWNRYKFDGYGYEGYNKELYATYLFKEHNPFSGAQNPVQEGDKALSARRLGDAILLYEAAVQQDPRNSEAWEKLGMAQADNEKDVHAIAALQKAVSLDPSRLGSWMSLSASYSNELCRPEAFNALQSWLENNPKYSQIVQGARLGTGDRHREVVSLFIDAARLSAHAGHLDPDVQLALGVLFNISNEYDKAIDCFSAAVQAKPDDFVMWNRLGATLANSGRSEQAIDAYYKALQLNPGFVRARYNLGISCISLDAHKEAAEHFLGALSQQMSTGNNDQSQTSKAIWDTLRMTFSSMMRDDLAEKCLHMDVGLFRGGEFDFQ